MKRKITWLVCLIFVIAALTVPVLAAKSASISLSASETTVNSGDKVTVTVSATVDSCGQGSIEVSYDTKVFELVSGECLLSNADISYFDTSSKDGGFAFDSATAISGKVFKFVLKVKDSASLGSSTVSVNFKADSIAASKSIKITVACNHKYDNSCDTTCNSCGATRSISHTWNSGKVTKAATCTSTGTKTYTCTVCGKTKTEEISKAAHTYDDSCDADCNVCGATRTVTHSYQWLSDETGHWEECSVCGDKKEIQEHTFESELSSNSSVHGYACSVCGMMSDAQEHEFENDCDTTCDICSYERSITHNYSEIWSSNEDGHWHECTVCGDQLEMVPHTPGEEATETTDQICLDCGYILQVAGNHEHSMAGDWLSNDVGHWYLCFCGEYTEPAAHVWDEGVIDEELAIVTYHCTECGHEMTEAYIPPTTEPSTAPTEAEDPTEPTEKPSNGSLYLDAILGDWFSAFPWWIVAAVLAVLLIISICFNVFLLRCLFASKKTGKYAKKEAYAEDENVPQQPEPQPEPEETPEAANEPAETEE